MNLNLIHIHRRRAQRLRHFDALTLRARRVRGHKALERGHEFRHHVQIRAEAARRQNDRLRVHGYFVARRADCLHADCLAVFIGQDGRRGGFQLNGNLVVLFASLFQQRNHVGADRDGLAFRIDRAMDTLDGRAAEAAHAGQINAVFLQPFNAVRRFVRQFFDQFGIVDALAADHGVQFHQLVAVEIADRVRLIVRPLLFDFFRQLGDGHVIRIGRARGLQRLFHASGFAEFVFILRGSIRRVHAARRADRVAADSRLTFQNDDVRALFRRRQRRSHASAARADNHDIRVIGGVVRLRRFGCRIGRPLYRVQTRRRDGIQHSHLDCFGRHRRAGNAVHVRRLRRHDAARHRLHSSIRNARRVAVLRHLNVRYHTVFIHGHADFDGALAADFAVTHARVRSRFRHCEAAHRQQHCKAEQRGSQLRKHRFHARTSLFCHFLEWHNYDTTFRTAVQGLLSIF